jgi:UDP-N-acetylglucosamine transferase subunit ALG13
MIFVTVGSQTPFDRLVRTVDEWACKCGRSDIFAQTGRSDWIPHHIAWTRFLNPEDFRRKISEASAIVAHAGAGIIINALEFEKPILIMPRRANLGETRNDHQIATARQFRKMDLVDVAMDELELISKLDQVENLRVTKSIKSHASKRLLEALDYFIRG